MLRPAPWQPDGRWVSMPLRKLHSSDNSTDVKIERQSFTALLVLATACLQFDGDVIARIEDHASIVTLKEAGYGEESPPCQSREGRLLAPCPHLTPRATLAMASTGIGLLRAPPATLTGPSCSGESVRRLVGSRPHRV